MQEQATDYEEWKEKEEAEKTKKEAAVKVVVGVEETGEKSLHELEGQDNGNIVKVWGILNSRPMLIFIDSGSTHTFRTSRLQKLVEHP